MRAVFLLTGVARLNPPALSRVSILRADWSRSGRLMAEEIRFFAYSNPILKF